MTSSFPGQATLAWPSSVRHVLHKIIHPLDALKEWDRRPRPMNIHPLPIRRKRALTIPLPDKAHRGFRKQRTHDQSQSLFLSRLPLDVRLLIYEYVLASPDILHVVYVDKSNRLASVRCHEPTTKRFPTHECALQRFVPDKLGYLSILYTCRQIYSESIHILYSKNTLDLTDSFIFDNLHNAMLPHRLASIRKLNLEIMIISLEGPDHPIEREALSKLFWGKCIVALSQMAENGLQRLEIRLWLIDRARSVHVDGEIPCSFGDKFLRSILYPLTGLNVPDFTVLLRNWPQEAGDVRRILGQEPNFSVKFFDCAYCPNS